MIIEMERCAEAKESSKQVFKGVGGHVGVGRKGHGINW